MKINKTNKAVLQCIKEIPSGNQNVMIELKGSHQRGSRKNSRDFAQNERYF